MGAIMNGAVTNLFRAPTHVDFNVTNACNLACSHCHSASGTSLANELSTSEVISIVKDLHDLGVLSVAFAGGEPFLRRDMPTILAYASSLPGWSVSVISNGLYLSDKRHVNALYACCPSVRVNISLDGSTPVIFSWLRHTSASRRHADSVALFNRVVSAIKICKEVGFQTSVNFTVSRANVADILSCYEFVVHELAKSLVLVKFFPEGYGKLAVGDLEIPFGLWSETMRLVTLRKMAGDLPRLQLSVPAPWEFYLPLIMADIDLRRAEEAWGYRSALREQAYFKARNLSDVAGVAEACVAADGNVYPSVLFTNDARLSCGNLRSARFSDLWYRSDVLRLLRSLSVEQLRGACSSCRLHSLCGGGSRSRAYALTGSLVSSDPTCPLALVPPPIRRGNRLVTVDVLSAPPCFSRQMSGGDTPAFMLGSNGNLARVYVNTDGCEVRFRNLVIHGDAQFRRVMQTAASGVAELEELASERTDARGSWSHAGLIELVLDTLGDLEKRGLPRSLWHRDWQALLAAMAQNVRRSSECQEPVRSTHMS
jgi:radical SAM protein with 4Fe4S-binding SPASM domain